MKTIIEKLGIKPILYNQTKFDKIVGTTSVIKSDLQKVQQQRNEMLEALIEEYTFLEKFLAEKASVIGPHWYNSFYERQVDLKCKIAKACYPKSWEETKELIK